jgi:hypothetical protein
VELVSYVRDGFIGLISHEHRDLDSTALGKLPSNPLRLSVHAGGTYLPTLATPHISTLCTNMNTRLTLAMHHHQLQPHMITPTPPVLQTQAGRQAVNMLRVSSTRR